MGCGTDALLTELCKASVEARQLYESALEERAQVIANTYGALPPLRDLGDAVLLGRSFPAPSVRLWQANLAHSDEGEAVLLASIDVVGKRLTKTIEKTNLFLERVLHTMAAKRRLDQAIESIRAAWRARQGSNAKTREDRDRDARVMRAFEGAVNRESTRLEVLEEFERRFGVGDTPKRAVLIQPDPQTLLDAELHDEFRSQHAEIDQTAASLAREWKHERDRFHTSSLFFTSLPNPLDWSTDDLRYAHRQFVLEVSDERYVLEATVQQLSAAHGSYELSKLCVFLRHVALQQLALDSVAQSTDDWTDAAQNEVVVLRPLKKQYEDALEAMVARSARRQSAWEVRTYAYLMTREDVQERVAAEILEPVSAEAHAEAVRETERAGIERIRLTAVLDALISKDGIELALADALANRCTEALLVREMRKRNPAWPESVQDLVDAVDDMLMQSTWRERNHRGSSGADEAMDRIYEWALRPGFFPRPRIVSMPDENDMDRPLLPCTITTNTAADAFSATNVHCQKKKLPTLSIAAATAYRRRWLR